MNQPPNQYPNPYFSNRPYPNQPPYYQQSPPKKPNIFRWYWRQKPVAKTAIGCILVPVALIVIFFVSAAVVGFGEAIQNPPGATPTVVTQAHLPISAPAPTATPKPTPTPKPTATPSPVPQQQVQPTQPPAPTSPPAPSCNGTIINGTCYNIDASGGSLVYSPPQAFCSYFTCVSTFWTATSGYVVECADTHWSHSGGVSGACSHNGGVMATLYSH